jgi:hypothetical protein
MPILAQLTLALPLARLAAKDSSTHSVRLAACECLSQQARVASLLGPPATRSPAVFWKTTGTHDALGADETNRMLLVTALGSRSISNDFAAGSRARQITCYTSVAAGRSRGCFSAPNSPFGRARKLCRPLRPGRPGCGSLFVIWEVKVNCLLLSGLVASETGPC